MIFFVIIVLLVGTFGNYLIPLKIGAGDMAFPFLNGLAFWIAAARRARSWSPAFSCPAAQRRPDGPAIRP